MERTHNVIDRAWCTLLPKVELHAHFSGSISKASLHKIWQRKREAGQCQNLEDPLVALKDMPDIFSFFKIFDTYIYKLVDDEVSIREAVHAVLDDFEDDGVVYLELRTTPRRIESAGIDQQRYVEIVLGAMVERPVRKDEQQRLESHLILSIDRRMSPEEANSVLALASSFRGGLTIPRAGAGTDRSATPRVVAIDLCGNPMKGDVSTFTNTFYKANEMDLPRVVHFAEVPESSTDTELETILSWEPSRLGHVIHVHDRLKQAIRDKDIALELCLSCNTIAQMTQGGFAEHHFGHWRSQKNNIALSTDDVGVFESPLSTDDVGVFESPLSNEYLQAAKHFDLSRTDCIALSRSAARAALAGNDRLYRILDDFQTRNG